MGTTHGSTRTEDRTEPRPAPSGGRGGRLAVALAGLALGVGALTACSSSTPAPSAGDGTVTVTSTTTAPPGPPTTSTSPSPSASSATTPAAGASTTAPAGGAEAPAPPSGGIPGCAPGQMRVTVKGAPGGGSAGHQELQVIATNTGTTACTLQGYPGVSLTAPGSGAQLGAAADRATGETPLMRLEPGRTAVAPIRVSQAGNYPDCGQTTAAGFRIYLPDQTAAAFAPFAIPACTTASVHQLSVMPFNA